MRHVSLVAMMLLVSVAHAAAPAPKATGATGATGAPKATVAPGATGTTGDLEAARALFRRNLDAIRHHDRAAYLACYWHSERLARTGPTGFIATFDSLERSTDNQWPEVFEASDLRVTPVEDGVVYGTYRYRVRFSGEESSGISERLFVRTADGWRIAVTTAFGNPAGTPAPPRALVGGTLVDGTGRAPVADALVLMRDGQIDYAGPAAGHAVPAGVDTVDVRGCWITPGLVDAHVHYSQTGWADGRPDAVDLRETYPYEEVERRLKAHPETFHHTYLACGVTAVFDVGGFPWTVAMQQSAENDTRAPHYVAAGPLLSTLDHWLNLPAERQFIYLANDSVARAGVHYLKSLGSSAVKVWFINTPARNFDEMARLVRVAGEEAHQEGLPLIVHATGLREAKAALEAGANLLVHSVWDQPVDDEFIALAKKNGTMYCPTITVIGGYWRLYDAMRAGKAPEVDDPCAALDSLTLAHIASTAGLGASRVPLSRVPTDSLKAARWRFMSENLMRVFRAGIPIAMGTDAGNPLTLHGVSVFGEMEAMQRAGMKPAEVLVAATRGGATAMGKARAFGTVEKGKAADLCVVGADPTRDIAAMRRVRYVVRAGVVRSAAELAVRK
jgi:imidazolonepropionase-like amidohydrolase